MKIRKTLIFNNLTFREMALTEEKINEIKQQLQGLKPEEQKAKLQEIMATLSPEEQQELMGGQQQCPFCLMAEGQIPVKKVYEDDVCLAILDINPAAKGHTLLFPKKHAPFLTAVDDDDVGHMFRVANMLSKAVFESLNAEGTNILVANGPAAGQTAPHALINIIPRFKDDKVQIGWEAQKISDEDMEDISKKISSKTSKIGKTETVIEQPKIEKKKEDFRKLDRIP